MFMQDMCTMDLLQKCRGSKLWLNVHCQSVILAFVYHHSSCELHQKHQFEHGPVMLCRSYTILQNTPSLEVVSVMLREAQSEMKIAWLQFCGECFPLVSFQAQIFYACRSVRVKQSLDLCSWRPPHGSLRGSSGYSIYEMRRYKVTMPDCILSRAVSSNPTQTQNGSSNHIQRRRFEA